MEIQNTLCKSYSLIQNPMWQKRRTREQRYSCCCQMLRVHLETRHSTSYHINKYKTYLWLKMRLTHRPQNNTFRCQSSWIYDFHFYSPPSFLREKTVSHQSKHCTIANADQYMCQSLSIYVLLLNCLSVVICTEWNWHFLVATCWSIHVPVSQHLCIVT